MTDAILSKHGWMAEHPGILYYARLLERQRAEEALKTIAARVAELEAFAPEVHPTQTANFENALRAAKAELKAAQDRVSDARTLEAEAAAAREAAGEAGQPL